MQQPAVDPYAVGFDVEYPEQDLNRLTSFFRVFVAIPILIVLVFLTLAALVVAVIAWCAILFTGRSPRWAFDFVVGVMRWHNRVFGYALVLVTDRYPPFQLH